MTDRIEEEAQRIRKLLTEELDEKRLSVRALERKLGVAVGTRRKVLNGAVGLSFRNILEILDAAEVDWGAFSGPPSRGLRPGLRPAQAHP